ncbi:hypothetical protein [Streptomyces sp. WZ.A104]|nr:hypothetical protein [Streptomyces sp. WZ.A104]
MTLDAPLDLGRIGTGIGHQAGQLCTVHAVPDLPSNLPRLRVLLGHF